MAPETAQRYPVAVLVSGSGSNLQAIIDATSDPEYGAEVAVVISDRPGAFGLERARAAGLPALVVDWSDFDDRTSFTEAVCDAADAHRARLLVLAGFMRILAPAAVERFPDRIVNTHPALLPSFPGAHAIAEALAHGVKLTGVTIHVVDEIVDHGPIILQEPVPVGDDDEEGSIMAKIQAVEHRLYPEVVDGFARGLISIDGRRVSWDRK